MSICDKNILLLIISSILLFIFFSDNNHNDSETDEETVEKLDNVDEIIKIDKNMCSQDCCNHTQWQVPHMEKKDDKYKDYVGSNFSCNNGEGSGCLCMSKTDLDYLANHGNNTMCKQLINN
jgi:hypothetical protein